MGMITASRTCPETNSGTRDEALVEFNMLTRAAEVLQESPLQPLCHGFSLSYCILPFLSLASCRHTFLPVRNHLPGLHMSTRVTFLHLMVDCKHTSLQRVLPDEIHAHPRLEPFRQCVAQQKVFQ